MTRKWVGQCLAVLPRADETARRNVSDRAANILRPAGALQALDDVAIWVAQWQATSQPAINQPAALVFAADHGVAQGGVSAYPTEVTAAMLKAYQEGRSTLSAFAAVAGATVHAVDVGVGKPTKDIRHEAAMSKMRLDEALEMGRRSVENLECDLLVIGEMGIGNTTVAAALTAALLGGTPSDWVGRGTGVDDEGLSRKLAAVEQATSRVFHLNDPIELLREVGGAELAAMVGAILAARMRRLPVVLDGYVVTAAALVLFQLDKTALDHCWIGHCSAEPGHRKLLHHLGKPHLLDLNMRLGEGSGAMAAVPLIKMACSGVVNVPTFEEWFGA
jgi:nicotinate-nucleotide--dimethylbenzimidazole phosphoribosyltransferase